MKTVIGEFLSAIKKKWQTWARKKIGIQMNNALAHKKLNKDVQIIEKPEEIKKVVLFRVIQSLRYTKLP